MDVQNTPLIWLSLCTQSWRSKVIRRGGGGLCLFSLYFELPHMMWIWILACCNPLQNDTLYETIMVLLNRIKIRRNRFLNLFWLFNVWYIYLEPGNKENTPKKLFYGLWLNWHPEGVPRTWHYRCHFRTFILCLCYVAAKT